MRVFGIDSLKGNYISITVLLLNSRSSHGRNLHVAHGCSHSQAIILTKAHRDVVSITTKGWIMA